MCTRIEHLQGMLDFISNTPLTPYGFSYRHRILWVLSRQEQKKYGQLDIHPAARKAIDLDIAHGFITLTPVTPT